MKIESLKLFLTTKDVSIVEAMQKIDRNAKGILFVVEEKQRLVGVVTDGDIRRWIIKTGELDSKIEYVMNKNPKKIFHTDVAVADKIMKKYGITALPIVDSKGVIVDIVLPGEVNISKITKSHRLKSVPVVIMAGGKGTRLYPYTKILPKPLIPIGDIPIIERIIDKFCNYGIEKFYVTVNYRKNMIKTYFSEALLECTIQYIEEDKPLGTAGSLGLIEETFNQPFIVTNCDILIHADYEDAYNYHKENENELTIVTALKNIVVPYGVVHSSENGSITSMEEKPKLSYFVNTGMYILNPELLNSIPKDTFFHMTDLVNKLLAEGRKVGMYPISEDSFLDMGEIEEMRRMETKLNIKSE